MSKRILANMIIMFVILLPGISCAESELSDFEQRLHTEIGSWTMNDAYNYLTEEWGMEPSYQEDTYLGYENISINGIQFDAIEFSVFKNEDPPARSAILFQILRPFGETAEDSKIYADILNYFQRIYGKGEVNSSSIELWGNPKIRWINEEDKVVMSVMYANEIISQGEPPVIDIWFCGYIPTE